LDGALAELLFDALGELFVLLLLLLFDFSAVAFGLVALLAFGEVALSFVGVVGFEAAEEALVGVVAIALNLDVSELTEPVLEVPLGLVVALVEGAIVGVVTFVGLAS
jgi:hypothetical protein